MDLEYLLDLNQDNFFFFLNRYLEMFSLTLLFYPLLLRVFSLVIINDYDDEWHGLKSIKSY